MTGDKIAQRDLQFTPCSLIHFYLHDWGTKAGSNLLLFHYNVLPHFVPNIYGSSKAVDILAKNCLMLSTNMFSARVFQVFGHWEEGTRGTFGTQSVVHPTTQCQVSGPWKGSYFWTTFCQGGHPCQYCKLEMCQFFFSHYNSSCIRWHLKSPLLMKSQKGKWPHWFVPLPGYPQWNKLTEEAVIYSDEWACHSFTETSFMGLLLHRMTDFIYSHRSVQHIGLRSQKVPCMSGIDGHMTECWYVRVEWDELKRDASSELKVKK